MRRIRTLRNHVTNIIVDEEFEPGSSHRLAAQNQSMVAQVFGCDQHLQERPYLVVC